MLTRRSSSPVDRIVATRPSRLASMTLEMVWRLTPSESAMARSSVTRSSGGPPSNEDRTSHSSGSVSSRCLMWSAPRRRSSSAFPETSTVIGGPAVPSASVSAERPISQVTSVIGRSASSGSSQFATSRPVGPSISIRARTLAVFSSVSSLRIRRSSSGSRPTSERVAASESPPACASRSSTPATATT